MCEKERERICKIYFAERLNEPKANVVFGEKQTISHTEHKNTQIKDEKKTVKRLIHIYSYNPTMNFE